MSAPTTVTCGGCGTATPDDLTGGWLIEAWPTLGGGRVSLCVCFVCRDLTGSSGGGELCDGRCGGGHQGHAAWRADCSSCQDYADDNEDEWESVAAWWACAERACVQAWVDQLHPYCHTRIATPWEVVL